MEQVEREWDHGLERLERESFVLLQHLYTVAEADPGRSATRAQVGEILGFTPVEVDRLVSHLMEEGCLAEAGLRVSITPFGVDYIERLARRRHSVRKGTSASFA